MSESPFPPDVDPITLGVPDYPPLEGVPWSQLFYESTNLIAETTVCGSLFGVVFTLYVMTVYFLIQQKRPDNKKRTFFYLIYSTIMVILGFVYVISSSRDADQTYVKHRLFPLGPYYYGNYTYSKPNIIMGSACWIFINFFADGLVLWRVFILYKASNLRWAVILPALMYLATLAMGLCTLIQSSLPNQSLFNDAINVGLTFFSLSVSMTVLSTLMMSARILYHRRQFQKQFGAGSAGDYTSIVSMLVESAALYAAFQIVFIPLFHVAHPMMYIFLASLAEVQIIAPLLIILRVSRGKAWNSRTQVELVSTLAAKNRSGTLLNSTTNASRTPSNLKFSVHQEISHHEDTDMHSLGYREPKAV